MLLSLLLFAPAAPARTFPADAAQRLDKLLSGTNTAFVLYDKADDRYVRFDPERCRKRLTPFSTFKIPNSLIGLETGVIADPDAVVKWDQTKYPAEDHWPEGWKRDQSLRSAFKASAVWFYRDLAKKVGRESMSGFLKRFEYGNQDQCGGIDTFWLNSSLKISADEQVEFLKAFLDGQLGLAPRTNRIAREIMVYEKTPAYTPVRQDRWRAGGARQGARLVRGIRGDWWQGVRLRSKHGWPELQRDPGQADRTHQGGAPGSRGVAGRMRA